VLSRATGLTGIVVRFLVGVFDFSNDAEDDGIVLTHGMLHLASYSLLRAPLFVRRARKALCQTAVPRSSSFGRLQKLKMFWRLVVTDCVSIMRPHARYSLLRARR